MSDFGGATSSSLDVLTRQYETITNNLVNSNVTGYKRRMTGFIQALQAQTGAGDGEVAGVTGIDFSQGNVVRTGRTLDMALDGKGFFVIESPEGEFYTRNGAFRLNQQRQIVDYAGRIVAGEAGPIVIPPDAGTSTIGVSRDGQVSAGGGPLGRIKVVDFEDTSVLIPTGSNTFKAPESVRPTAAGDTGIQQGFQENSNVNIVEELVSLITVTRMYEANMKNIRIADERMKTILQVAMS